MLYIYFLYTPTLFTIIFLYFLLLLPMLMQENHHNRIPPFLRNVYGCLTSFHITRVHCTPIVNKNFISLQYKLKTRKFTLLFGLVLIMDLSWAKIMIASLFCWCSFLWCWCAVSSEWASCCLYFWFREHITLPLPPMAYGIVFGIFYFIFSNFLFPHLNLILRLKPPSKRREGVFGEISLTREHRELNSFL